MSPVPTVSIQREDFDPGAEIEALVAGRADIGAVASFVGLCRDEAGRLAALELEHYPGMAEAEVGSAATEACGRWPLLGLTVIHRYGRIRPAERIVLVAAAAGHRGDAFAATDFLMDYLKSRAPFWKRETLRDGTSGGWVEARVADHDALQRWRAQ